MCERGCGPRHSLAFGARRLGVANLPLPWYVGAVLPSASTRARELLAAKLPYRDPNTDRFVAHLREHDRGEIAAIIFYGSLLSKLTETATSFHDFYVIIDSLAAHRRLRDRLVGSVLPPSIYYRTYADGLRCKYCVLLRKQFQRETSAAAHDIHNMGRFSKRVALVFARDAQATELVIDGCLEAARQLVPHALALSPTRFQLDDFLRTLLSLSYLGEQRVAEDAKVEALLSAEREHYRALYGALLEEAGLSPQDGIYQQPPPSPAARRATEAFLGRSRRRGKLRWPKYIVTVDDWLEIILAKIERHHGVRIELSERERRWPLIFGWPKYFALKRRGLVK
jgi:hypothetical protein